MRYVVFTLLVWVPIVVLISVVYATSTYSEDSFNLAPNPGDIAGVLVGVGLLFYLLGLLAIRWLDKTRGPHPR